MVCLFEFRIMAEDFVVVKIFIREFLDLGFRVNVSNGELQVNEGAYESVKNLIVLLTFFRLENTGGMKGLRKR